MPQSIDPQTPTDSVEPQRLFLIGYRGSGKTSVAKALAELLEWPVCDTDAMIVAAANTTIKEIFETEGEAHFRELETESIELVAQKAPPLIVSLGGGAPTIDQNRAIIGNAGVAIWLRAAAETLWKRISADQMTEEQRPDLTDQGGLQEIENVLKWRTPLYQQTADLVVDVDEHSIQTTAKMILAQLSHRSRAGN